MPVGRGACRIREQLLGDLYLAPTAVALEDPKHPTQNPKTLNYPEPTQPRMRPNFFTPSKDPGWKRFLADEGFVVLTAGSLWLSGCRVLGFRGLGVLAFRI